MEEETNELYTTLITAPISGTVVKRNVVEGQYVKEGENLLEMADLGVMWFRFEVYEQDLPMISLGQMVEVTSPALGNKTVRGPITFIEPTVNEATRSARVRVELKNPLVGEGERARRALYNGLYADGRIEIQSEPVLAVPETAVIHPGDQPRVYVDNGGGAYEMRMVELGRKGDGFWEIRKGVEEGESVVISGNLMIDSQAQINRTGSGHSHGAAESSVSGEHEHAGADHEASGSGRIAHAQAFIQYISEISAALAADDLERYNQLVEQRASPEIAKLRDGLAEDGASTAALNQLPNFPLAPAKTLAAARQQFAPFSAASVKLVQEWRRRHPEIAAKTYVCPMYPKMGEKAFWVQAEGPLRNPFYGSEMLECGQEIK